MTLVKNKEKFEGFRELKETERWQSNVFIKEYITCGDGLKRPLLKDEIIQKQDQRYDIHKGWIPVEEFLVGKEARCCGKLLRTTRQLD